MHAKKLKFPFAVFAGPAAAPRNEERPLPTVVPNDHDTIEELQQKMVNIHARGESLRALADQEHRNLSDDETSELDDLDEQFQKLDAEVGRRQRLQAQRDRLSTPQQRVTQPSVLPAPENAAAPQRQRITGGEPAGATKGSMGFRSFGEFAKSVQNAQTSGRLDQRLMAAATTYANEGTNADGGFAVPPDFRETIVKKIQGEESLLPRTDQMYSNSNKIVFPQDNTAPWDSTSGVQAYWTAEGAQKTQSKPALGQMELTAHKLAALVPVTDELLEDVPALSRYLQSKVADKFNSVINDALVNGDGVGKPQGLLQSASKISVAKEAGQAADTVVFANIAKMWSRLPPSLRPGAVWIYNTDIEPQLLQMTAPGNNWPAYLPPGGLSAAPYGTLFGRPMIAVEAAKTVGDEGDIILTNLAAYATIQKTGGMKTDVSIHLYFDQDITAFRFVIRIGGQSWWSAPISPKNGSNTKSNIVTLADRA